MANLTALTTTILVVIFFYVLENIISSKCSPWSIRPWVCFFLRWNGWSEVDREYWSSVATKKWSIHSAVHPGPVDTHTRALHMDLPLPSSAIADGYSAPAPAGEGKALSGVRSAFSRLVKKGAPRPTGRAPPGSPSHVQTRTGALQTPDTRGTIQPHHSTFIDRCTPSVCTFRIYLYYLLRR